MPREGGGRSHRGGAPDRSAACGAWDRARERPRGYVSDADRGACPRRAYEPSRATPCAGVVAPLEDRPSIAGHHAAAGDCRHRRVRPGPQRHRPLLADRHADGRAVLAPPTAKHLFGTDQFGRDVFSLVIYGARQSLFIGVFGALTGATVGVSMGMTAGYAGGRLGATLMRYIDVWMAIPTIM